MTDNTNNQNKESMSIASTLAGIILGLIACALITLCSSCTTTKYVPVIEHHTDTVMVNKVQKDSVFLHDSTYVYEKGDTFYMERWHAKYVLKELHDTLYQSKTDSIPYPVEVTKEVPAQLTWWQQTRIHVGGAVIWLALIILIVYIIRIFRKAHTLP